MSKSEKKRNKYYDNFFFDDCPICQAMKKAEEQGKSLSLPELRKAFREAEDKSR